MNNLENIENLDNAFRSIGPVIIKGMGILGLVLLGISILGKLYYLINKKNKKFPLHCITGVILYITSLLFHFFISYDPFSDLKMQVSVSFYVVFSTMVIMILFNAKKKLSNKPEEKKK